MWDVCLSKERINWSLESVEQAEQAASHRGQDRRDAAVSCCEAMNGVLYLGLSRGSVSVAQRIQKQNPRNLGPITGAMLFNVGLNVSHEGPASRSIRLKRGVRVIHSLNQ